MIDKENVDKELLVKIADDVLEYLKSLGIESQVILQSLGSGDDKHGQLSALLRKMKGNTEKEKVSLDKEKDSERMVDLIGYPATYELLAEECTELAQASLKKARLIRGQNPTPVTHEAVDRALIEEWTDVVAVIMELGLLADYELMERKHKRLIERINAKDKNTWL